MSGKAIAVDGCVLVPVAPATGTITIEPNQASEEILINNKGVYFKEIKFKVSALQIKVISFYLLLGLLQIHYYMYIEVKTLNNQVNIKVFLYMCWELKIRLLKLLQ